MIACIGSNPPRRNVKSGNGSLPTSLTVIMTSNELIDWLVRGGGSVHRHVEFDSTADGGRGIFASARLPAGTELISVPHALCLHVPRPPPDGQASCEDTTDAAADEVRQPAGHSYARLFLLHASACHSLSLCCTL